MSRAARCARGADSPEGYFLDSFDYAALERELLAPLGPDGSRCFRTAVFNYRTDRPLGTAVRIALDDAVLLFDGVFLQRSELDGRWDLTVWVDAPLEHTVERAVARDVRNGGDAVVTRGKYERCYVPGQHLYLMQCRPRERADVVFENADPAHPAVRFQRRSAPAAAV